MGLFCSPLLPSSTPTRVAPRELGGPRSHRRLHPPGSSVTFTVSTNATSVAVVTPLGRRVASSSTSSTHTRRLPSADLDNCQLLVFVFKGNLSANDSFFFSDLFSSFFYLFFDFFSNNNNVLCSIHQKIINNKCFTTKKKSVPVQRE